MSIVCFSPKINHQDGYRERKILLLARDFYWAMQNHAELFAACCDGLLSKEEVGGRFFPTF